MYDQHTTGMATTRYWSLVGRGGRKCFDRDKAKKSKKCQYTDISNLKKRFEQIEFPAKLLNYFL